MRCLLCVCFIGQTSNRSWRSLRKMEEFSFLHVMEFLLSQKMYSLNINWDSTEAQRVSKTPDERVVWARVRLIYIPMAVTEVHGDKSEIMLSHLALVL